MRNDGWNGRASRRALAAALCVWTGAALGQTFPGPGEGAFTWERLGDVPVNPAALAWTPQGRLVANGSFATYNVLNALAGQAGIWERYDAPQSYSPGLIVLSDGTVLIGQRTIDRSTNGGLTWVRTCDSSVDGCVGPDTFPSFRELPAGHPHAGRVISGTRLYSDDRGATWTQAGYTGPQADPPDIADVAVLPSGRLLAASDGWGLLSSDDGGASWTAHPTLYAPYRYATYAVTPFATPGSVQSGAPSCGLADTSLCEGAVAIGTDATDAYNRVWLTSDGGRTWRQGEPLVQLYDGVSQFVVAGLFDLGLDAATGLGRAVAVLGRGFVFATRDGGQTWAVVARAPVAGTGSESKVVHSAVLGLDGRLYAAVVNNNSFEPEWVYRTVEPVTAAFPVAGEAPPAAPSALGVSVRPNPAGGRVEVVVSLAAAGAVRVVVLDALGREVAVVLAGEASAGERVVGVDTSAWPAGVYVVRATAGAQVATARLVVAR